MRSWKGRGSASHALPDQDRLKKKPACIASRLSFCLSQSAGFVQAVVECFFAPPALIVDAGNHYEPHCAKECGLQEIKPVVGIFLEHECGCDLFGYKAQPSE